MSSIENPEMEENGLQKKLRVTKEESSYDIQYCNGKLRQIIEKVW